MAEAQVGARKTGVARLNVRHAWLAAFVEHVARKDFFRDGHRPRSRLQRRQKDLLLQSRNVEGKQPAVLDHLPRNLVFATGEFAERDVFTGANTVDEAKVSRGQHAQVLAI